MQIKQGRAQVDGDQGEGAADALVDQGLLAEAGAVDAACGSGEQQDPEGPLDHCGPVGLGEKVADGGEQSRDLIHMARTSKFR